MTIPGSGVPPVQALAVDIGRLKQGREEDQSRVRQEIVHVRERSDGIGGMLDHFEADDAIEAMGWPGGVARDERVVGIRLREACGTQQLRQETIAAAVIENPPWLGGGKQAAQ